MDIEQFPPSPGTRAANGAEDGLVEEYLAECQERLLTIRTNLLALAKSGEEPGSESLVNGVFRAVHAIRAGVFFDLTKIGKLAEDMEEVLGLIRSREMVPNSYKIGILLLATDRLEELIHNSARSNEADIGRITGALERLHATRPAIAMPRNGRRLRTLVVEDDALSRLLLTAFLSRYGDCDVAVNGREAVEAFRSGCELGQNYDLICMDIMMPEMDGREAVRQVRALEEASAIAAVPVKIMMMTSIDDAREMIRSFQDFSDAYLIKPVNLNNVLRHLKTYRLVCP